MKAKQKDNSTGRRKIALRRSALREIDSPSIVETHGGVGTLFLSCYAQHKTGVVFETDEKKADRLAEQRPGWSVYQTDCVRGLEAGAGFHFQPNFFDLDPYGECWHVVDAIFDGMQVRAHKPPRIVLVVNDGLRQHVRITGGWQTSSLQEMVRKYGSDKLYKMYLDVCKELVGTKAAAAGYGLHRWTAYRCGHFGDMTHFAAVLTQTAPPPPMAGPAAVSGTP